MSQRAGSRARGFLSRGALLSLLLHVHLLAPIGVADLDLRRAASRRRARPSARRRWTSSFRTRPRPSCPRTCRRSSRRRTSWSRPSRSRRSRRRSRREEAGDEGAAAAEAQGRAREEDRRAARAEARGAAAAAARAAAAGAREDRRPGEREEGRAAARREVPGAGQPPRRQGDRRARHARSRSAKNNEQGRTQLPTAEKDKVAELEDQKSALGRKAPDVTPHENPQVAETHERKDEPKSLLALRDPAPRTHEMTPETADPVAAAKAADGDIAMSRPARGAARRSVAA